MTMFFGFVFGVVEYLWIERIILMEAQFNLDEFPMHYNDGAF